MTFPALRASYWWLLKIVIGSSHCLSLLWLVGVIALVLVFRQSFENRSIRFGSWRRPWNFVNTGGEVSGFATVSGFIKVLNHSWIQIGVSWVYSGTTSKAIKKDLKRTWAIQICRTTRTHEKFGFKVYSDAQCSPTLHGFRIHNDPGARFSKVPRTFRARKGIR